ncbi:MAG: hypothetical protein AB1813_00135 [Verrucomicrobiota bacterium]
MRDPFAHNHLLDRFLNEAPPVDRVIANGDFSCDSAFVGVCDAAAFASAEECLHKLRARFRELLLATIGDHELGKTSLVGGKGGLRLESWNRAVEGLQLKPFWRIELEDYLLIGITSSLVALPVYGQEALVEELPAWERLRAAHLESIRMTFAEVRAGQRLLLFCHDPTALPFLWEEAAVRAKSSQIECTVIGHLHTRIIFWKSRALAGFPRITRCGPAIRRMSSALRRARHWKPFKPILCPSLSGIELMKRGGYLSAHLPADPQRPVQFRLHVMRR